MGRPGGSFRHLTRLECLLLLGLLAAFGWGLFFAFSPAMSSPETRNAERQRDVEALRNALALYALEHNGRYPSDIGEEARPICQEQTTSCAGMIDLRVLVPRYIEHIPADPFAIGIEETFYMAHREGNHIIVTAPHAEGKEVLRVER